MNLGDHLESLPDDLAKALSETFDATVGHYLQREWDDAQVDAGRFCEAGLRYLQWKQKGSYTPIDGRSKPNRKAVVGSCQQDTSLPSSLRAQVPQAIELVMDFRNNRNAAHLGDIDANRLDAITVMHLVQWTLGEVVRLETQQSSAAVQGLLEKLAEPYVPLIQYVDDEPTVLDPAMPGSEKALVLLYQAGGPVSQETLRKWAEYANATRWRKAILADLAKRKLIQVRGDDVYLLHPGTAAAQRLLLERG